MRNVMLILVSLMFLFSCENIAVDATELGVVEGRVTIGPLCGNVPIVTNNSNPCGFTDEQINQFYANYKVAIYSENAPKVAIKEITLNKTGLFSFQVPEGAYSVEVILPAGMPNNQPILVGNELKKTVSITKSKVTTISLNVNTGIL